MTTALSPDSRMLIAMMRSAAIQNAAWVSDASNPGAAASMNHRST
jgi:hypothetical protein